MPGCIRDASRKPKFIALESDRIFVQYPDWTVQVDQNVADEKGAHFLDVFTQSTGEDGGFRAVTVDDKFRAYAVSIWGSVRPELARTAEKKSAQYRFENSLESAHELLAEFTNALNDHKFNSKNKEDKQIVWDLVGDRVELFYTDPNKDTHMIHLRPVSATNLRLASLELEDDDGMHVFISDPEELKPLRSRLEIFLRQQMTSNNMLAKLAVSDPKRYSVIIAGLKRHI